MYEKPLKLHHKSHPSLGFASSVLQNVGWYWQAGKPVFKTVFYFFVISVALLLSTGFLAQFTHDKMNCSRSTCTWLNVKNHPRIRDNYQADQNHHISHLFSSGSCDFVHFLLQSLQALHHLRIFGELFSVTSLSMQPQKSGGVSFKMNFKCASLTFGHWWRVTDQFCSRLGPHFRERTSTRVGSSVNPLAVGTHGRKGIGNRWLYSLKTAVSVSWNSVNPN